MRKGAIATIRPSHPIEEDSIRSGVPRRDTLESRNASAWIVGHSFASPRVSWLEAWSEAERLPSHAISAAAAIPSLTFPPRFPLGGCQVFRERKRATGARCKIK